MKKINTVLAFTMFMLNAVADVTVTSVETHLRYPWSGKVDIEVTMVGSSNDVSLAECYFFATNMATMAAINVLHIEQKGLDVGSGINWVRRFVWDVAADVGQVEIGKISLAVLAIPAVQLWENGPYWAKCNVGAIKPEDYGYYFWWGDAIGYIRNSSNSGWLSVNDGSSFSFESGNTASYGMSNWSLQWAGYIDSTGNLTADHDAATVHLGSPWRMPTSAEIYALCSNCTAICTTCNGVYGRLVTGKGNYSDRSIFLPAAGSGFDTYLLITGSIGGTIGSIGGYWSSTPTSGNSSDAWILYLDPVDFCRSTATRNVGVAVRPLREFHNMGAALTNFVFDTSDDLTITAITAVQQYPNNGKVDIAVMFVGESNEVANAECHFFATNMSTMTAINISHIEQNESDSGSGTNWVRRFVWDAASDVGKVEIEDVSLSVTATPGVQLWENGPYWAKCNVGASRPEEYGYYFWWGDTVGYKRNENNSGWVSVKDGSSFLFAEEYCPTYGMSDAALQAAGYIDLTGNLTAAYDAAAAHLGSSWRMPTDTEFWALISNCDTITIARNGVQGRLVTGRGVYSSKSIFLPAGSFGLGSDYGHGFDCDYVGTSGFYWSSTTYTNSSSSVYAWNLGFDSSNCVPYQDRRRRGQPIRAVREFCEAVITVHISLDCRPSATTEPWPDGNYTQTTNGYTWSFLIQNGEAKIGTFDDYGNCLGNQAVIPEPIGCIEVPDTLGGCPAVGVEQGAFYGCDGLTKVIIPASVTNLSVNAFYQCPNFVEIDVDGENPHYSVRNGILCDKDGTLAIMCPEGYVGVVTIPDTVSRVDYSAIAWCPSVTSVVIPSSVIEIGENAFLNLTSCTGFDVADDNPNYRSIDGVLYTKDGATLLRYPASKSGALVLPEEVSSLSAMVFSGCELITSMEFRGGVPQGFEAAQIDSNVTIKCYDAYYKDWESVLSSAGFNNVEVVDERRIKASFSNVSLFRTDLESDIKIENIFSPEQQPIAGDSYGLQATVSFSDGTIRKVVQDIDLNNVEVYFACKKGVENWGRETWGDAEWIPLKKVAVGFDDSKTNMTFRSSVSIPESLKIAELGVVQYSIKVVYFDRGVECCCYIAAEDWQNPSRYAPVDLNDGQTYWTPYSIIEDVAPGQVWFNEINIFDGLDESYNNIAETNQYIEIAVPQHVDLTGWKIKLITREYSDEFFEETLYSFNYRIDSVRSETNGVMFVDLISPKTHRAGSYDEGSLVWDYLEAANMHDGEISYDEPIALKLENGYGVCKQIVVLSGTNFWSQYSFGEECEPTTLANELIDVYGDEVVDLIGKDDGVGSLSLMSTGVGNENDWIAGADYTPGRVNCNCEEIVQQISSDHVVFPRSIHCIIQLMLGEHIFYEGSPQPDTLVVLQNSEQYLTFTLTENYKISQANANGVDAMDQIGNHSDTEFSLHLPTSALLNHILFVQLTASLDAVSEGGCLFVKGKLYGVDPDVQSIVVPDWVTEIPAMSCAYSTNLVSITIPASVTNIGDYAFFDCVNLAEINFGNGLISIGSGAFAHCVTLKDVVLPESLRELGPTIARKNPDVGRWFCSNTEYKTNYVQTAYYYPANGNVPTAYDQYISMTNINNSSSFICQGLGVFQECTNLVTVTMNDGLRSIGGGTFMNCLRLESLYIPDSVVEIGCLAESSYQYQHDDLHYSSLHPSIVESTESTIKLSREVASLSSHERCNEDTITISGFAEGCGALSSVKLPSGLTELGGNAFASCTSLRDISIPDSVRVIHAGAFRYCSRLRNVVLPEGLEILGAYDQQNVHSHDERESTEYLEASNGSVICASDSEVRDAFSEYNEVGGKEVICTTITWSNGFKLTLVHTNDLAGIAWTPDPHYATIETDDEDREWVDGSSFVSALGELGASLTDEEYSRLIETRHRYYPKTAFLSKAQGVFYGCMNLRSVNLPKSLKRISDYAFYDCCDLTSIEIPQDIDMLGYEVFGGQTSLLNISTPWFNCGDLWEIFPSHSFVTNLVLTKSSPRVQDPSDYIARRIDEFRELYCWPDGYEISEWEIGEIKEECLSELWIYNDFPLDGFYKLRSLTLPDGLQAIGSYFGWAGCSYLECVRLPTSLLEIDRMAFMDAPFGDLVIPSSLESLGEFAFQWSQITNLVFMGNAPRQVSSDVFFCEDGEWNPWYGAREDLVVSTYPGTTGWGGIYGDDELPDDGLWPTMASIYKRRSIRHIEQQYSPTANFTYCESATGEIKNIPQTWLQSYGLLSVDSGGSASVANLAPIPSRSLYESYVAGLDPTDEDDLFTAKIEFVDGAPKITWDPELTPAEAAKRRYVTYGKASLSDTEWSVVDGDEINYNFFKVTVEMP